MGSNESYTDVVEMMQSAQVAALLELTATSVSELELQQAVIVAITGPTVSAELHVSDSENNFSFAEKSKSKPMLFFRIKHSS